MTVEEAKKIYIKYDCSLFSMAREEKKAYSEFMKINISETMLEEWKQELFLFWLKELKENGSSKLFNKMFQLSENMHKKETVLTLKEALNYVKYESLETNVCIAEMILGRKELSVRSGMIFQAYDLGEYEMAKELLNLVDRLLDFQTNDKYLLCRCERATNKCHLIGCELNFATEM